MCRTLPDYHVVDQCSDGVTALRMSLEKRLDIAIVDLDLPDLFSVKVFGKLKDANIATRVVALSARPNRNTVLEVLRSGVSAFLLKSGPSDQLAEAFEHILGCGIYVSAALELKWIFNSRKHPNQRGHSYL